MFVINVLLLLLLIRLDNMDGVVINALLSTFMLLLIRLANKAAFDIDVSLLSLLLLIQLTNVFDINVLLSPL